MYSIEIKSEKAALPLAQNILPSIRALVRFWVLFHASYDIACHDNLNVHSGLSIVGSFIRHAARHTQLNCFDFLQSNRNFTQGCSMKREIDTNIAFAIDTTSVIETICRSRKQLQYAIAIASVVLALAVFPAHSEDKFSKTSAEEYLIQEFFQSSEATQKEERIERKLQPGPEWSFSKRLAATSSAEDRVIRRPSLSPDRFPSAKNNANSQVIIST